MAEEGPGNTELRNWEQIAVQLPMHSLQSIRDGARSWATILSALVGISTVIGLVQGRDSLSKLALGTQIAFAVAWLIALIAAIVATYSAGIASQGKVYEGWNDAESIRNWYKQEVGNAVTNLKRSWFLSGVAVIALVVAILINLFGPVQTNAGSVLVVQKSGSVMCGTLQKDKAGNLLLSQDGQAPIALNNIVSINVISTCP